MAATIPVRGVMTPTWMVLAAGSNPGAAARVPLAPPVVLLVPPQAAATTATTPSTATIRMSLDSFIRLLTESVRERPCLEVRLDAQPYGRQPPGFEDQEHDDECAEDDLVELEHGQMEAAAARRLGDEGDVLAVAVDDLGDGADEDGPQDGAEDRAHAPHDDDGDV